MGDYTSVCSKCGAMLASNAAVCPYCGAVTEQTDQKAAPPVYTFVDDEQDDFDKTTSAFRSFRRPEEPAPIQTEAQSEPSSFTRTGDDGAFRSAAEPVTEVPPKSQLASMTLEEFYNQFASQRTKGFVKWLMILCFLNAGVAAVLTAMLGSFMLINVALFAAFGILLLKKRSWVVTLVIACYCGLDFVMSLIGFGLPSGIVLLVLAVAATTSLKKLQEAYRAYQADGRYPELGI